MVKYKALTLQELEIQSFITNLQLSDRQAAGGREEALQALRGETLDERPCTFPSMEPEGCR